ncbi:TIR domain-containing protein [Streptomyces sp. NBC_00878]|uniref:TIR domain-containing protein n=1 Tax=Streptomyces sp. NBC_00878 TaxID=2975854 RepID=UPI0022580D91|nr:TIR domain-containing protein [Streptomyces sp. NBC_00878]MCX4905726.1 TIR domain-containing protein [Streptomyces sp. NBC_00878]
MEEIRFDAFLSYSKRENEPLAHALHNGLHRLAKPWHRLRAVDVFRDAHDLSASASLKGSIKEALLSSEYFVLVASPASAQSRWVREEIALWRENRPATKVLLVLAGGELRWDPTVGDFDWTVTTALPRPEAERWFAEEPLWVDMRAIPMLELRMRNPVFQDAVATVSAPLRGCSKAQLVSEDLRLHRRAVRVRRSLLVGLTVLSVLAASAAVVAWQQRDEARAQARRALSRALAAAAQDRSDDDPQLAIRLGLYAYEADSTPEAKAQLMRLIAANGRITSFVRRAYQSFPGREKANGITVKSIVLSPDGRMAALVHQQVNDVIVWDTVRHREIALLPSRTGTTGGNLTPYVDFDDSGRTLTVSNPSSGRAAEWEVPSGKLRKTGPMSSSVPSASEEPPFLPDLPDECVFRGPATPEAPWRPWDASRAAERLVIVCDGGELRVLNTRSGAVVASKRLDPGVAWIATAISADGKWITAGNSDGDVVSFAADLSAEQSLARHSNSVADIAMNADGSVVLSTSDVGDVVQSSLPDEAQLANVTAGIRSRDTVNDFPYTSLTASPDGRWLLTWQSGSVELWDVRRRVRHAIYRQAAQAVSFSPDGRRFALLEGDTIRVRDTQSLKTLAERTARGDSAAKGRALTSAVGGFRIVTERSNAGSVNSGPLTVSAVWDGGRRVLSTPSGYPATAVNGRYFAVAIPSKTDTDGQVSDWTVTVWQCDGLLAPKALWRTRTDRSLSKVAVSDDGEYLVLGDIEDKGEIVRRSQPDRPRPMDGGNTVSGSSEYVIAHEQGVVVQHTDGIRQGADEADSHNQLLLWDLATGRLVGSWKEPMATVPRGQLTHLALVEDGTRVATIRPNGNIGLWNVSPADWRADLCRLADGEPTPSQLAFYLDGVDVPTPCPG